MAKAKTNIQRVEDGLELLRAGLAPFVARELVANFGDSWWEKGVISLLEQKAKKLPTTGSDPKLVDLLDVAALLQVMKNQFYVIGKKLSPDEKSYVFELIGTRNKWAHQGAEDFSPGDAHRALDTMARLMERIHGETAKTLRGMSHEAEAYDLPEPLPLGEKKVRGPHEVAAKDTALKPWREVITPHPDVAAGKYKQTEFAANLGDVLTGKGSAEYTEPVDFFERTFITSGMKPLLASCLERVSGKGGEPIIQLKTAFGGGKTHTLLALYHILNGKARAEQMAGVPELLKETRIPALPVGKFAILVGTDLSVEKPMIHKDHKGLYTRTLWGEMAVQLGGKKAYDLVAEADAKGVAPSTETLREILGGFGPAVILMDEVVAYARQLHGNEGLPAGSFDSFMTFIHNLTEAVKRTKNALLVVSIPESTIEIGGEGGKAALQSIEHTVGRMEAVWMPVGAGEAFEVVRRRLFLNVRDRPAMEATCTAFSKMYAQHSQELPPSCREGAYLERIRSCYPIHPEVFDRLYEDWSSLERFQRTRGVLRLMAATIHALWQRQDQGLLILPASVPLDFPRVRDELTRYLSDEWNAIVDGDVDGPRSEPYAIDAEHPRFGQYAAARRVTRTVFLGSAPSSKEQRARGIEDLRIRLGCLQPGEEISVFNDALGKLCDRLTHLYGAGGRYWFDTPPNLTRTVEDRAHAVEAYRVTEELERRLKASKERGVFRAVHIFVTSQDVPDEDAVRLVILNPKQAHSKTDSEALKAAGEILESRGTGPRLGRNMLLFLAPDKEALEPLLAETRRYIAWKSVVDDADPLNLDGVQRKQAKDNLGRSDRTVQGRLEEAFCWLLAPQQEGAGPLEWRAVRLPGAGADPVAKASKKAKADEMVIPIWSAANLRMELDRWLWKESDHAPLKRVWECLTQYIYLPRLQDRDVLADAVKDGLPYADFFAYAQGQDAAGKYTGMSLGKAGPRVLVDGGSLLVKPEIAKKQLEEPLPPPPSPREDEDDDRGGGGDGLPEPPPKNPKRFYGTVTLSTLRLGAEAGAIAEEIVARLANQPGAVIEVTLDIEAKIPGGADDALVRTITENAMGLKFQTHEFSKE